MLKLVKTNQERVDLLFENPGEQRQRPIHDKIATIASRGVSSPGDLSPDDIAKVCYALVVHSSQMGIGQGVAAR